MTKHNLKIEAVRLLEMISVLAFGVGATLALAVGGDYVVPCIVMVSAGLVCSIWMTWWRDTLIIDDTEARLNAYYARPPRQPTPVPQAEPLPDDAMVLRDEFRALCRSIVEKTQLAENRAGTFALYLKSQHDHLARVTRERDDFKGLADVMAQAQEVLASYPVPMHIESPPLAVQDQRQFLPAEVSEVSLQRLADELDEMNRKQFQRRHIEGVQS